MKKYINYKLILGIFLATIVPIIGAILTKASIVWPISTLVYNLGLIYSFALAPSRITKIIIYNILAATLFIIEAAFFFSYFLQNAGFNETFFYHFSLDLFYAGFNEYLLIIFLIIICMVVFLTSASHYLAKKSLSRSRWRFSALILLLLGLFISPPAKALILYVENLSVENANDDLFENFPELLGSKVIVDYSKSEKPNIVLIYAESLEQNYFDETLFPGLLTNLKKIKSESIDFTNVSQGVGAEWTIGGMVASQCAYPLAIPFNVDGNDLGIFDNFLPKATCIGDFLKKDGYHLTFIGTADARFAGKGDFLRSHGYNEIIDRDYLLRTLTDKSYRNAWGVFDDTLLDYAIKKFNNLNSENSPFLMTLLTIGTHHPNGYMSKSCKIYESGENPILNNIHCSDQLISKLVKQIRNSPYSKNTIIIVMSDHLAMRNTASNLLESSQIPRRLTFFINTHDKTNEKNVNSGVHYDIAPTILDFLGYDIKGQIGFGAPLISGAGFLPGKFGENKWKDESANIMAIANLQWDNEVILNQDGIKLLTSNGVLIMGEREFNLTSQGSPVPPSIIFTFNNKSLKLEKIKSFPLDKGLNQKTLGDILIKNKENLTFVISRSKNLIGFTDSRLHPDIWTYFLGKPGSDFSYSGPLGDRNLIIGFDSIKKLSQSKLDDRIISKREYLLKSITRKNT